MGENYEVTMLVDCFSSCHGFVIAIYFLDSTCNFKHRLASYLVNLWLRAFANAGQEAQKKRF